MDGRGNRGVHEKHADRYGEQHYPFDYAWGARPIPDDTNETRVQQTRDMVKNGQLPGVEIGNFAAKAFREAVQHTTNKTDSGKGDSSDLGRESDPGFYRAPFGKPNGNEHDLNKHPDQPKNSISSHRNPDGGYSHRNPDILPVPKTQGSEDWINKHPGQKPDPWRPTDEGNRTQGEQPEDREQKVQGQQAENREQKVQGELPNKTQGQQPEDGNKVEGQPPTDKGPINAHHNENKPANPERPKPGFTCEDLENAEGKLPPSKLPPRRCPEFYFENPVKPR